MQPTALTLSDTSTQCFGYLGFAPTEWAYILKRHPGGLGPSLDFRLDIEDNASIRNPVLGVKDWGNANVKIRVDGVDFGDFKLGQAKHPDGVDLVLWLNLQVGHSVGLSILPLEGQTLNLRTSPPDPYRCDIPVFPEGSSETRPFGAYYAHLKYTKSWDELWCVGTYADIVVQFDDYPCRLLFWRGTGNLPHWSNEQNRWYSNQFVERRAGMPVSLVVAVSRCRTTNVVILTPALFQVMTPGLSSTGVTHHATNTTGILSWTKPVEGIELTSTTLSILIPSVCEKPPSTLLNQINSTSGMKRSHWYYSRG